MKIFKSFFNTITPVLFLFFTIAGCQSGADSSLGTTDLSTTIDSVSYSIGFLNGSNMKDQGMGNIETEAYLAGMQAAMADQESDVPQERFQSLLSTYQMEAQQRAQQQQQEEADANQQEGSDFLAENKANEGVQVTESGLQYRVLEEGDGLSPNANDSVRVHYEGTLIDGTVFDSSIDRGEPVTFPLSQVISGWTEGLQLMQEGARYKFFVPGNLAYGQNPPPRSPIGPNETLIFEVELIEVIETGSGE